MCGRRPSKPTSPELSVPLLAAVGVDPATGRQEEGVAVRGLPEAEVLALGMRYGQDAVFAWTPTEWAIVACRGGRRLVSSWSLVESRARILLQPDICHADLMNGGGARSAGGTPRGNDGALRREQG